MWDASARSRARWRSCIWSRRPMATLLLEIGCEELPAAACREAEAQLPMLVERELGARPESVFVGPRRIAALLLDVDERTPDEWVKGPPEHLADKAAAGFAKRHGVEVEALVAREGFLGFERPGSSRTRRSAGARSCPGSTRSAAGATRAGCWRRSCTWSRA